MSIERAYIDDLSNLLFLVVLKAACMSAHNSSPELPIEIFHRENHYS